MTASWGQADGLLGGLFGMLLGSYCRPRAEDMNASCCACRDDGELLTAAWRRNADSDDVLPLKLDGQSGGAGEERAGGGGGANASRADEYEGSRGVPPVLQVPAEFDLVRLSRFGEAPATGSRTPEEQQQLLQMCLRSFARALLRGIRMSVLLDDGRTLLTEASLDSELTHLVLHMPNVQCPVALRCIEKICSPDEVSAGAVVTTNQAYLDERCTTLVLRGGQFLTFVFESSRSREYFEMCLKVVILAKGGASLGDGKSQNLPDVSPTALQQSFASANSVNSSSPFPADPNISNPSKDSGAAPEEGGQPGMPASAQETVT